MLVADTEVEDLYWFRHSEQISQDSKCKILTHVESDFQYKLRVCNTTCCTLFAHSFVIGTKRSSPYLPVKTDQPRLRSSAILHGRFFCDYIRVTNN
ncbi:hypothetical protein BaRGS_00027752 [Batillaria attramentaria]|uniref:Uncharacterized protein n=1 Tax=Batillaria attramentaria TaxID=370345 RepID=A0ABD0K2G3_9CAEN